MEKYKPYLSPSITGDYEVECKFCKEATWHNEDGKCLDCGRNKLVEAN